MKHFLLSLLALGCFSVSQAATETYQIDPVHSSIGFTVRHIFTKVPGQFTKFSGTITVDRDNLENSKTEAAIDTASIDTRNTKRDSDLKGDTYLVADKYPKIEFVSKTWKKTGEDTFDVTGDLTIRGVTKSVELKVKSLGFGPGMMGKPVSGWEGTTKLNRHDFNINLSAPLEKILGDEIDVTITVEAGLKS